MLYLVIRALKTLYETSTIAHDPSLYMLQATQFALETHGWTFGPDGKISSRFDRYSLLMCE